jgi:hypothetical protein
VCGEELLCGEERDGLNTDGISEFGNETPLPTQTPEYTRHSTHIDLADETSVEEPVRSP